MTSAPKSRLTMLSEQLQNPIRSPGTFESIPVIPTVAKPGPRVAGKVVIITGADSPLGIGRAAAHQFARHGARAVYLCDRSNEHLPIHKRELESLYPGVAIHVSSFDAASESAVAAVVDSALSTYGRLDIFFANAGVALPAGRIWEADADIFSETMRINALSVFLAAKHGSRGMMQTGAQKQYPGGSIVATASTAGIRSNAGPTDYSASKAAVISMMQTACYQLAGTGIRCNALCPGIIHTGITDPMYEMAKNRGTERKIGQLNPLQRGGVADEVANVALFLGSDESSYVNGQAWAVDGGLSAGHPFVPGKMA